jgi:hypothetical protein
MFAMKKFAPLLALLALSCGNQGLDTQDRGNVTFYNASSYSVTIYHTSFSGLVLAEKLASGKSISASISPSDNYGAGDIFAFEYFFMVASGNEVLGEDIWAKNELEVNDQERQNIEAGKNYTIRIPNPKNWQSYEAFVKIINKSSKSIEFNHLGAFYRMAGNLETSVPSGKVGVYKVNGISSIEPSIEIEGRTITQMVQQYTIPTFIAEIGNIYTLEFDGKEVKLIMEHKI